MRKAKIIQFLVFKRYDLGVQRKYYYCQ